MRLEWKNDEDAVKTLNRMAMQWSCVTVPISSIDVKTSRHNHARKQAIIDSNVDDYTDAMDRGDVFPRIVLARVDGSRQWLVAGGNHRLAAAIKLGVTEIDAYATECDSGMFALLCPALNLYVGQREDRSVRARQAADAVTRLGISQKQAAEEYRVEASAVSKIVCETRVIIAAEKHGINADDLTPAHLHAISTVESDAVLLPLAIELARTKLNAKEVRSIIQDTKRLPTEADRISMLKEQIQSAKKITLSGRVTKQPARTRIMRCVTMLSTLITKQSTLNQLQITEEESQELARKLTVMKHYLLNLRNT